MTTDTTIRRATPDDVEIIAANNIAMAKETEAIQLSPDVVRPGVAAILSDSAKGVYFIAERAGGVVGQLMITYEWSDWRNGTIWWIQSVYVLPEARRSSVYRLLHQHVEQAARQTPDVTALRLYVYHENTRAQQTYERLGMHQTGYRIYETDWSSE